MALLTQYRTFFISPFGEETVCNELNAFLRSHRIVNVEKRLIDGERGTGWLFLVEFCGEEKNTPAGGAQRVDYREVLSPSDYALFDKLRELRKEAAEKQGLPAYAVFTNEQLAAIVKKQPKSPKDLLSIPGIGESRVKQYGALFLKVFEPLPQGITQDEAGE
ncbi:MAG: HRDC domain-containing protein [Treponema sp.]|jgi:superfamily II DNA helicase RecQ|nr:HRDC domain-containing protein [Treponema sp.]